MIAEEHGHCCFAGRDGDPADLEPSDSERTSIPEGLPEIIDAHVHVFPDRVFDALWRWFENNAWPVRYKLYANEVVEFLLGRGVSQIVALHYAHKPDMAQSLNVHMAEICRRHPRVHGVATVHPSDTAPVDILRHAEQLGLRGVKLHCHVQCVAPDDRALDPVYAFCSDHKWPVVIHAGYAPRNQAYKCNLDDVSGVYRVERVLVRYPDLRLCVPHLGADEFEPSLALLSRFDNLWLDTTMMMARYFSWHIPPEVFSRPGRILYGTDFPNLPYAWDRELRELARRCAPDVLVRILGGAAREFFDLGATAPVPSSL